MSRCGTQEDLNESVSELLGHGAVEYKVYSIVDKGQYID